MGRDAELAAIAVFLERARAGPAGVMLSGPPGIGKTTIWRAAQDLANEQQLRVLDARGVEAEARLPFAGLIDLLDSVADLVLPALPEVQSSALAVALRRTAPGQVEPDPMTASLAAMGALRALAVEQPILVAIDDLQWLDPSSRRAVGFAARRMRSEAVGWLVTVRRGHADVAQSWRQVLPQTAQDEIELGALPLPALERLLRERLGVGFLRPTLLRIERAAGGNPFFALELGRALLRRGLRFAPEVLPVPEDIGELLRERLASLSRGARDVVLVAAALSSPTRHGIETAVPGRRAAAGLQEAVRAGVLERDGELIRFTHPLFASVTYEDATPAERHAAHGRIAARAADAEERARHLALASERRSERVSRALEQAAQAARTRGSPEVAAQLSELALRRTPAHRPDDGRRRGVAAARYLMHAGDPEQARTILRELLAATAAGPARAELLVRLADTHTGDSLDMATGLLAEAAEQAGESVFRIAAERRLATACWTALTDVRAGREHAQRALRLAERAGDPGELAASLVTLAWLESIVDGTVQHDLLERAARLEPHLPSPVLDALIVPRGIILGWAGDVDAARDAFLRIHAEALRIGNWHALVHPIFESVELELRAGNWVRASQYAKQAGEIASQLGHPLIQGIVLMRMAHVSACLGQVNDARRDGERGLLLAREVGARLQESYAEGVLGFLELSLGNADAAHRHSGRGMQLRVQAGVGNPSAMVGVADDVEALVMLGSLEEASASLTPFEERARELDLTSPMARAARCRGLIRAAAADMPGAGRSLEGALALHERLGEPFERARTLLVLGEVQRRDRRRGAARGSLRAALTTFEELGARLWAERARRSLARIGELRPRSGISETDQRIIELVAAGKTNRQVAAVLFMSRHTVDSHLRKIYQTLGIRSRAQLVGRVSPDAADLPSSVDVGG